MRVPSRSPKGTRFYEYRNWTLNDLAIGSAVAVALMVVSTIALEAVLSLLSPGDVNEAEGRLTIAVFATEGLLIIPAWWWGPRKYGGGWPRLGLVAFDWQNALVWILGAFTLTLVANTAWEPIRVALGWSTQPELLPLFGGGVQGLVWALFVGSVIAPLSEEVFFRGFLYVGLRDRWGVGWAVAISALIFGVIHLTPGVLVPIALIGAVLAGLYEITGSLWPSIIFHAFINALVMISAHAAGG